MVCISFANLICFNMPQYHKLDWFVQLIFDWYQIGILPTFWTYLTSWSLCLAQIFEYFPGFICLYTFLYTVISLVHNYYGSNFDKNSYTLSACLKRRQRMLQLYLSYNHLLKLLSRSSRLKGRLRPIINTFPHFI